MKNQLEAKTYAVHYLDDESIKRLEQVGDIVYRSPILNLFYLQTSLSPAEIEKLSGVYQVNECGVGLLLGNVGGIRRAAYSN
ncbi:hypothetical protein ABD91_20750 [Lysinibacillus sphaericus]|uniref:hypothetical protein n=1 Tax=Lysinibacillus sphaericus TaxID=1421 RepID=UPI0018CF2A52|nr:hypothetical protein [Lysinibacillus sphaericus]MBG9693173.1 hypothetical protein [Lysinibacillus sphaericus]